MTTRQLGSRGRAVLLLAVVSGGQALAAEVGLRELLEAADQNNFDRRVMAEQLRRAREDTRQAWSALAPTLLATGTWTHNQHEVSLDFAASTNQLLQLVGQLFELKPGVPGVPEIPSQLLIISPANQLDGLARVDLPLVDTTRWMRIRAQQIAEAGAEERESLTRDVVKRQVVTTWYAYAAALAVRESATRSAEVARRQLELMEIRGNVGVVTELELLRSRAEVERTRQVVADTTTAVNTTRRMLSTLTGVAVPEQAPLPTDALAEERPQAELESRVDLLPGVRAADRDAEAATTLASSAKLVLVPTVAANFTERVSNATGFVGEQFNWSAGMSLTWRLDPQVFFLMRAQDALASSASIVAEKARAQARDQIYVDRQKLDAARLKVVAAAAQVQSAQRAAQVARDRYAVGAATQVDVIQAERDLFLAEVAQISARTEVASARASLRISAGLPLDAEATARDSNGAGPPAGESLPSR